MRESKRDMAGLIRSRHRWVGAVVAGSAYLLVSFALFYMAPNTRLLSGFHGRGYFEQSVLDAFFCTFPADIRLEAAYFAKIFFLLPGSLFSGIVGIVFRAPSLMRGFEPIPTMFISVLAFGAYGALVAEKKNRRAALILAVLYLVAIFVFQYFVRALGAGLCALD